MRTTSPWLAWPLLVALAAPGPALAAGPTLREAEVPLAVEVAAPGPSDMSERADEAGPRDMSEETDERPVLSDRSGRLAVEGPAPPASAIPATPRIPVPTAPIGPDSPERVTIAVGLGPSAPGSKPEKAVVDALERSALASTAPRTQVRRLRAGAGEGKAICRERRDDLVILLEYLPDREDAVLLTRDCRLDRDLGVRGQAAAREPGLVDALWDEHLGLVRDGARERKVRISRKLRTGLIAGGAIVAVGLAIALVLASSLRRDTVVIMVGR